MEGIAHERLHQPQIHAREGAGSWASLRERRAHRVGSGVLGGRPREAQQGGADAADGDRHVQPAQEGALVGEEGLGLDLHWDGSGHAVLRRAARVQEPTIDPAALLPLSIRAQPCVSPDTSHCGVYEHATLTPVRMRHGGGRGAGRQAGRQAPATALGSGSSCSVGSSPRSG